MPTGRAASLLLFYPRHPLNKTCKGHPDSLLASPPLGCDPYSQITGCSSFSHRPVGSLRGVTSMKRGSGADLENKLAVTVGRGRGNTGWERGGHRLPGVRQARGLLHQYNTGKTANILS